MRYAVLGALGRTGWAPDRDRDPSGHHRGADAHRAGRGAAHPQALRALGNRLVGILHGCLAYRVAYQEQVAWPAAEPAA
jgi:hypothetical protein